MASGERNRQRRTPRPADSVTHSRNVDSEATLVRHERFLDPGRSDPDLTVSVEARPSTETMSGHHFTSARIPIGPYPKRLPARGRVLLRPAGR
jgi:hypothetical protein